ncbi:MAG: hemerythrin domain-containing protein [Myxococcales bacterium]|nr:hemerythrin domain-containing protein [Myxococcales bacterium]
MTTTIFDALRQSHRDVEELFGDVQNAIATEQIELAKMLFQLVSVKLTATMSAEHSVVYPRFAREADLLDEVTTALLEHSGISRMIDLLRVGGLRTDEWCEAVAQLGQLVADHTDCEECALFPIAGLALSSTASRQIADEYRAHVRMVSPIAGASITWEVPPPELAPMVVVRFKAA